MTVLIEEDTRDMIGADDWGFVVAEPREQQRAMLESAYQDFLRNGGQVTVVAPGVSTTPALGVYIVPFMRPAEKQVDFSPEAQRSHHREQKAKVVRQQAGDEKLIKEIKEFLGLYNPEHTTAFIKLLHVSDDRFQRALRQHFADDDRYDKYRRIVRGSLEQEARYKELADQIQMAAAAGIVGYLALAKHCNTSSETVKMLKKKFKLDLPKGLPGTQMAREVCSNCKKPVHKNAFFCKGCGTITKAGLNR